MYHCRIAQARGLNNLSNGLIDGIAQRYDRVKNVYTGRWNLITLILVYKCNTLIHTGKVTILSRNRSHFEDSDGADFDKFLLAALDVLQRDLTVEEKALEIPRTALGMGSTSVLDYDHFSVIQQ